MVRFIPQAVVYVNCILDSSQGRGPCRSFEEFFLCDCITVDTMQLLPKPTGLCLHCRAALLCICQLWAIGVLLWQLLLTVAPT